MAVDEARRSRSYERLAEVIGRDEAATIFDLLPPPGLDVATRGDIQAIDQRFDAIDQRFEAIDRRFEAIDHRLDRVEDGLREIREDLRGLRSDVTLAIAGQSRALVAGVLTATVSIGGLSAVLAQLF